MFGTDISISGVAMVNFSVINICLLYFTKKYKPPKTERAGFEPAQRVLYPLDGLANRCLQPLGHLSSTLLF